MPTESVLKRVTELGGFDSVLNNLTFQHYLSNYYRIPLNSLRVRLISLHQDTLKKQNEGIKSLYKK